MALERALDGLGVEVIGFAVRPSLEGQDDFAEIALRILPEALMDAGQIQAAADKVAFDALTHSLGDIFESEEPEPDEETEAVARTRKALEEWNLDEG